MILLPPSLQFQEYRSMAPYCLCSAGHGSQGFEHAGQAFYQLSYTPQPCFLFLTFLHIYLCVCVCEKVCPHELCVKCVWYKYVCV